MWGTKEILEGFIEEASFLLEECMEFWRAEQDISGEGLALLRL